MNRETKIGLLVGLAFILVIGILLSDHFRSITEPPQALLSGAGDKVRQGVVSPGIGTPPITVVTPSVVVPSTPIPTGPDVTPAPSPVVPAPTPAPTPTPVQPTVTPPTTPDRGPAELENPEPKPVPPHAPIEILPGPTMPALAPLPSLKPYVAQPGDTLGRIAGRIMGTNSKANRTAIINANRGMAGDPDLIVAGATYMIPVPAAALAPTPAQTPAPTPTPTDPTVATPAPATTTAEVYVVAAGDNLWRIASDVCGDPGTLDQLRQLNKDVLKGKDNLKVGMKLKLPPKAIASAR